MSERFPGKKEMSLTNARGDRILGFFCSLYLREFEERIVLVAMTTVKESDKHSLVLPGFNATLEETKIAYDERASIWEQVNMHV